MVILAFHFGPSICDPQPFCQSIESPLNLLAADLVSICKSGYVIGGLLAVMLFFLFHAGIGPLGQ